MSPSPVANIGLILPLLSYRSLRLTIALRPVDIQTFALAVTLERHAIAALVHYDTRDLAVRSDASRHQHDVRGAIGDNVGRDPEGRVVLSLLVI